MSPRVGTFPCQFLVRAACLQSPGGVFQNRECLLFLTLSRFSCHRDRMYPVLADRGWRQIIAVSWRECVSRGTSRTSSLSRTALAEGKVQVAWKSAWYDTTLVPTPTREAAPRVKTALCPRVFPEKQSEPRVGEWRSAFFDGRDPLYSWVGLNQTTCLFQGERIDQNESCRFLFLWFRWSGQRVVTAAGVWRRILFEVSE
mmetsp:Transcript_21337/g.49221  ORF Transcript_21337/g.49221 Transcript_21337/m.49221 type:complete len:200 (+) Transcript_21337:1743-2342(+)